MDIMDIHDGFPKIAMDIMDIMDIHDGYPKIATDFHGYPWISKGVRHPDELKSDSVRLS